MRCLSKPDNKINLIFMQLEILLKFIAANQ